MEILSFDFGTKNSNPRKSKTYNPSGEVSKITIHHMAGVMDAKQCAEMHKAGTKASANYYIGVKGEIVAGVSEDRRAWTSSSRTNDYQAITIEVSNNANNAPWEVSNASMDALIALCVDICIRHKIAKIIYTGHSNGNLTEHRMFAKTECPGEYLHSRMSWIADKINSIICTPKTENTYIVQKGDTLYKIAKDHNTSVIALRSINPQITNPNKIYPGQEVILRW
ncbi:MAG: N-acetylmuramoyl-L-alanine amidase [Erysipelotrichaceae bacterium]|nr:N-acetylmuramoyl-L-alanine amidase [Erysipelotrichaceae bacterium]